MLEGPVKVGVLIRRRLEELGRTSDELAEVVEVPPQYIDDLISGRRRPPRPSRTDIYERMTPFLRLGRHDLATYASTELDENGAVPAVLPRLAVRRLLLDLCEPATAQMLQGQGKRADARLADYCQRLLDRTQAVVRRTLIDPMTLRMAAQRSNGTYAAMRMRVLDFLDATAETLTTRDLARFVQPWVAAWDVDLETGVLRVVMHGHDAKAHRESRAFGA